MTFTINKYDASLTIPDLTISNVTIKQYALATSSLHPEGGMEYELILKKKPPRNYFTIPFTSVNLRAKYQPPLTEELNPSDFDVLTETEAWKDGKRVIYRPPEVVGSYAVYHKTKRDNQYKTGKLFHIYRPKLIDKLGNEAWGTINIANSEFTVSAPQQFLDNATYPVIIDPTFGKTDIGGSNFDPPDKTGCRFQAPANGNITKLSIHIGPLYWGAGTFKVALYNDSAGSPGSLAGSDVNTVSWVANSWNDHNLSVAIINGNWYWLTFKTSVQVRCHWDAGVANQLARKSMTYADPFTDPFGTPDNTYAYEPSIYATYTPTAGLSIPVAMHHYNRINKKIRG